MSEFSIHITGRIGNRKFKKMVREAIEDTYLLEFENQSVEVEYDSDSNHKHLGVYEKWKVVYRSNSGFYIKITDSGNNKYALIADYVDRGTKEHIIPNKKDYWDMISGMKPLKYLKFPMRYNKKQASKLDYDIPINKTFIRDGFVYTLAVVHPGIKARKYVDRIMSDSYISDRFIEILFDKDFDLTVKYLDTLSIKSNYSLK